MSYSIVGFMFDRLALEAFLTKKIGELKIKT